MRAVDASPSSLETASASRRGASPRSPIKKRIAQNYLVLRSRRVTRPPATSVTMTTIALPRPIPPHRSTSPLAPPSHSLQHQDAINSSATCPIPIPNKHLPVCPPGTSPAEKPDTPPASPPSKHADLSSQTLLYPVSPKYEKVALGRANLFSIQPSDVSAALKHIAGQPLPDANQLFPWLHGLNPANHIQQSFFVGRNKKAKRTPVCYRGITIVKANGDLSTSRLKGAIAPDEFLDLAKGAFKEIDPKDGFSVRNFQIQAAKIARLSDVVVYGENEIETFKLANLIAKAQTNWYENHKKLGQYIPTYNTFMCVGPFEQFESQHRDIVVVDSNGQMTGEVLDFFQQERLEMATMTKASEIAHNVFLGPTPDPSLDPTISEAGEAGFDLFIECSDQGRLNAQALKELVLEMDKNGKEAPTYIEFPSSGSVMPPQFSMDEADEIVESCRWVYYLANGIRPISQADHDGGTDACKQKPKRVLIHCTDGYTESTMFAIAYYIFAHGVSVSTAWLQLHVQKQRNFFSYPSDVALLNASASRLLAASPAHSHSTEEIAKVVQSEPEWLKKMDGSIPSRITDYMYLGNLGHANNPELLRELGIGQVLSVGEIASWEIDGEWEGKVCIVQGVQDNGMDPLTDEFERCLEFIDRGRRSGTATLVHCRVGVSRSATICIAEVMREYNLSYPRAYCFVRARRLNVIIQPHLRFSYELLKWEETLQQRRGEEIKREREWGDVAREIAAMNRPYAP